ncbi:hypothetical protein V1264_013125 [Littorina saxatilis]|uniref:Uncharacterized protein n=1 Tax=Littorina saxatilis TaxID=31220 RepID=A0AAN9GI72_9CAEN
MSDVSCWSNSYVSRELVFIPDGRTPWQPMCDLLGRRHRVETKGEIDAGFNRDVIGTKRRSTAGVFFGRAKEQL